MLFRKKPVVIEAVQLRWDTWSEMCEHACVGKLKDGRPEGRSDPNDADNMFLDIPTLEGLMTANKNDWVIKGVNGELYPCKPDIFEKTYEPVVPILPEPHNTGKPSEATGSPETDTPQESAEHPGSGKPYRQNWEL